MSGSGSACPYPNNKSTDYFCGQYQYLHIRLWIKIEQVAKDAGGNTVCPYQDPHIFIRKLHKEKWCSELIYLDANDIRTLYGKIKDKKTLTRVFFHHYQIPFNNKLSALCVLILCLMGELVIFSINITNAYMYSASNPSYPCTI